MLPLFGKESFIIFLKEGEVENIINYVAENKLEDENVFKEVMNDFNGEEHAVFWSKSYDLIDDAFKCISNCVVELRATPEQALKIINIFINLISLSIDILETAPVSLMEIILYCGEMIKYLGPEKEDLKTKIVELCEKCYFKDIPMKNDIITPVAVHYIKESLTITCSKTAKSYIKKIYTVKESLNCILTKETVNQEEFRQLLLQCVKSSLYYSLSEGRKFLGRVFCIEDLIDPFHDAIKRMITSSTTRECQLFGEVYEIGWIEAGKECLEKAREEIEWKIQDIMDHAVNIPRDRNVLLPKLRKFLSAFHVKRSDHMILKLLCKLYKPILWRALEHPLGYIRANAAQLLIDVFPLEDPDLLIVEAQAELNSQLSMLLKFLSDDCPWVRCVTTVGICNILAFQRELVNSNMITQYLCKIAGDLSQDMSLPKVRLSVLKGMKILLQNHFPVPILKTVLSKISGLFNDPFEKVRISFCQFLLDIKKHPSIKYWEIVPVNDLLESMTDDKPPIQKLLVQLMYNSYIPVEDSELSWLQRCTNLIDQNLEASRIFFLEVTHIIGLPVTIKFIQFIYRALYVFARIKSQQRETGNYSYRVPTTPREEDEKLLLKLLEAEGNNNILIGFTDAAYIMFRSILGELEKPKNKKVYKSLIGKIAKKMPDLLKFFQDEKGIWETLFAMTSYIPTSLYQNFSDMCYIKLQALSENAKSNEYKTLLECLCNVGKGFELLKYIQMSFQAGLQSVHQNNFKIRAKRSIKANDFCFEPAQAALYLVTLLTYRNPRVIILSQNTEQVKDFLSNTEILQKVIVDSRRTLNDETKYLFLTRSFSALVIIAIHMHCPNKHNLQLIDTDSYLRNLSKWVSSTFLSISSEEGRDRKKTKLWNNLGQKICSDLLNYLHIIVTNKVLQTPASDYMQFIENVIDSDYGPSLMDLCINLVFGLSQYCKLLSAPIDLQKENQALIYPVFSKIVETLQNDEFYNDLPSKGKDEIKSLKLLLLSQSMITFETINPLDHLTRKILDIVSQDIVSRLDICNEYKKVIFPAPSTMLLTVIAAHQKILMSFLITIETYIVDKELPDISATSVIFAKTIQENKANARKIQNTVHQVFSSLKAKIETISKKGENSRCQMSLLKSSLRHVHELFFPKNGPSSITETIIMDDEDKENSMMIVENEESEK